MIASLRHELNLRFRHWQLRRACKRLERITQEKRNSYAVRDYAKRRAAMLKVTRGEA